MDNRNEEILFELREIKSLLKIIAEGISPTHPQQTVESSNISVEEIISLYQSKRRNKH